MTDSIKEQVSAYLDGELPERELAMLSKRVEQDRALSSTMARYVQIGETLRTSKPMLISSDFSAAVMAQVRAERLASSSRLLKMSPATLQRLRPVAGIAIAASVAALVVGVFSVQRIDVGTPQVLVGGPASSVGDLAAVEQVTDRYVVPAVSASPSAFIPATRLTNYVVAHSEYSSPLGRRTVLSGVLAEADDELLEGRTETASPRQDPEP